MTRWPEARPRIRQVFEAVAEMPGLKSTAPEIADELGFSPKEVSTYLTRLAARGLVQRQSQGKGRGKVAYYWVPDGESA